MQKCSFFPQFFSTDSAKNHRLVRFRKDLLKIYFGKTECAARAERGFSEEGCNPQEVGKSVLYLGHDGWLQRRS